MEKEKEIFLIDFDNESKNYERIINVSNCSNIKIGTNHSCQISLKGHYVNNDLLEFHSCLRLIGKG